MQVSIGTTHIGPLPQSRETVMDEFEHGELKWGERQWTMFNVIIIVRPDDPYSIQGFYNDESVFVGWYVNLQDPLTWSRFGYDTRDHFLDIIVGEDLKSWMWKDEDELARAVVLGLISSDEATSIRVNGEAVVDLIERGDIWWADWRNTVPDVSLPIPVLPRGWDVL